MNEMMRPQTQDSKFEPWLYEAQHATSRSRRLPTIVNPHYYTSEQGRKANIYHT